ncbi:MAG: type III pantothenate kinase, partial [Chloroflexota bacterium]
VADLGTATTLDVVGPDGGYRGGAILPGIALGATALAAGTALLPAIAPTVPPTAIGAETAGALHSGLVLGHVGALRELVVRSAAEIAPDGPLPPLVCTGGSPARDAVARLLAAPGVAGLPSLDVRVAPDLLLEGLLRLAGTLPVAA